MKNKGSKAVRKIIGVMCAVLLLMGQAPMETKAAGRDVVCDDQILYFESIIVDRMLTERNPSVRAMLYNCMINVMPSSSGMWIDFFTDCTQTASVIGVKDIEIKKKVWYGWKLVATSNGAESTNDYTFGCGFNYTDAEKGETYRISCTHYANADEYREVYNELEVVFTY